MLRSIGQLVTDFRSSKKAMEDVEKKLPRIIGAVGVRVVKDNFRLQGYDSGFGVTPWPKRKDSTNKRYDSRSGIKGSVINSENKILIQTHNLINSIKYKPSGKSVAVGSDLTIIPYAKIHNEGGTIKMNSRKGAYSITMPKRQFIPLGSPNIKIINAITKKVKSLTDQAMKIFTK